MPSVITIVAFISNATQKNQIRLPYYLSSKKKMVGHLEGGAALGPIPCWEKICCKWEE